MIRNVFNSCNYYICGPGYIETNRFYYRLCSEKYLVIDIDLTTDIPDSININLPGESSESMVNIFGFNNYNSFMDLVNDIAFNHRFHVQNPFYSFTNRNEHLITITIPNYLFNSQISSNGHLYLAINIDNNEQFSFYIDGKIILTYSDNIGFAPYCSYVDYNLDNLSLKVNKANGDLFLFLNLFNTLDPKFPISFPLLYHKDVGLVSNYEYQFDINDNEILVTDSSCYRQSFIYIDHSDAYFSPYAYGLIEELHDEDLFYFCPISGSYIIKRNNAFKICSKDKMQLFFALIENKYQLYEINKDNNKINFFYNDFGQLTTIIEGINTVSLSYLSSISKIPSQISSSNSTDPSLRISQTNNGYLFSLFTPLNIDPIKEVLLSLFDSKITEIKDNIKNEKYQIYYDSDDSLSSVIYKKNDIEVNSETYLFSDNKTEISSLNIKNIYYFDKYLRPISQIDGNYNISSFSYSEIENSKASNVSSFTKSINKRRNYILNHLFDDLSGWNFSGRGTHRLVNDSIFGDTSLEVVTSSNQTLTISQTIIRPKKESYILKALIKQLTNSNVTINLTGSYRVPSAFISEVSTVINVDGIADKWIDYTSSVLDFPSNTSSIISLTITITIPENTVIIFDHLSLNDDYIDEKINLIKNGYLEKIASNIPTDWSFLNKEDGDVFINNSTNPFIENTHDTREFKFASKTFDGIIKEMYQNVGPLSKGKYVLSIISKCFGYPNTTYQAFIKLIYSNNEEKEYTFDFLKSYPYYQCLSRGVLIDEDVPSLIVGVRYDGGNEAIFDSFELIRESNFADFNNDIRNNIFESALSVTSFDNYSNPKFIINNNDEQILNVFDSDKKYLIKNSYKDNDKWLSYDYDDHENLISISVGHEEVFFNRTYEYSNNLLISSKDEFDTEVTYLYDVYHRLINETVDETKMFYQYDYKNNLTNLSLIKKSTSVTKSSNVIIYNNDSSISETLNSNQSDYEYVYNSIGQLSFIKINNVSLESFTYNDMHLLNTKVLNNQTFSYEYDDKNRLSSYSFLDKRYEYSYNAFSNVARVLDTNNDISVYYSYNSSGQLEKESGEDYQYFYQYDINNRLIKKKHSSDNYLLSCDYKKEDKSSFNDHIIEVNNSYNLDTILPYLPNTGIRGVRYQTNIEKIKDSSIDRFVYRFLSNSNYLNIDLDSTYLDARDSSYINILKTSKTIILWIKATLLTDDFLNFYSDDILKSSFSLSSGHLSFMNQVTSANLRFDKYNLLAINISIKEGNTIYAISINGSNYEEFISSNSSPIDKLRIQIDDGATTNLLCAFLGNVKIKENELLKLYGKGSELLKPKNSFKEGISFNNASNSNSLDLFTFDKSFTSIRGNKAINNTLYDESSFIFEPNFNKYVFDASDAPAIRLPNKLTKGSIAIRFKLFSNSLDTSSTRRTLFSFANSSGNDIVSFYFSINKIYLLIGNYFSSYAFTKRDEYITIRINFNESNVKVDIGLPLATIKTITENINLTNLTLCIGNNYSDQFPLNGLIDFVAIRDEISSEFISLNQLVNIYTEKDDFNRLSSITNSLTSYQIEYSYFKTRINQETHINHDTFEYSYDDFGRVTAILRNSGPHKTYSFDEFGRLINDGNNTYSYDSNGNRLSKNSNIYNYDEAIKDRLNSVSNVNNETIYSLTYSNNPLYPSSITKNGTTNSLSWVGDMLTAYGGYSYSYDSYGRRIKKTYTTQIPHRIIDIYYRYENNKLVFLEKDNLLNKLTIFFIYNELNQLVAASCNSQIYFYIHDILNNIIGITDSNGNYIAKFDYDGFGNITEDIITTNSTYLSFLNLQPFRYKDYIYDEETGLYWLFSRYYDPEIGRFISPDSVDYLDPTSINGLNLYAYCNNDPVNYCDPSGHIAITTAIILGLIGIGAIVGGATAGVINYNNGNTGWDLAIDIIGGAIIGGAIGGTIGYFAGPSIAGLLASSGYIGGGLAFAGISGTVAGGIAISSLGEMALVSSIAVTGILSGITVMAAQWKPGSWPGDDPTIPPGDGFEWRGKQPIGGDKGAWFNPNTGDSLHPDLNHPQPIGPHWDWINKILEIVKRIFR